MKKSIQEIRIEIEFVKKPQTEMMLEVKISIE